MNINQDHVSDLVQCYGFSNWISNSPLLPMDTPSSGYYRFTTDELIQWFKYICGDSSPPIRVELNIALQSFHKCTQLSSDTDPNNLWDWRLDP